MTASPTPLTIVVDDRGAHVLVRISGDVDLLSVTALRTTLEDALFGGCASLTVDGADVTFIDSVGLGILVGIHKRARVLKTDLVIWRPAAGFARVMAVTGLDRVFCVESRGDHDPRGRYDPSSNATSV